MSTALGWRMSRNLGLLLAAVLTVAACNGAAGEPTTTTTTTPAPATTTTLVGTTSTSEPAPTTITPPATTTTVPAYLAPDALVIEAFPVPAGSRPHDVAPAADGGVWYTAQHLGELGWLDPDSGETVHYPLGAGSRPHGVITDEGGVAWITDGGLNAIVSFDPETETSTVYPLPNAFPNTNLNTAAFDGDGVLWFTGQGGVYGSLDPATGSLEVFEAPGGRGPYGITATPDGDVYYASLAGSHIAAIEGDTATVIDPPTPGQGARRVWSDSAGAIWVSEWNSGNVSRYVPETGEWATWPLPGNAATYAVYVDEVDVVWLSDFGANAMVRFDPRTEEFHTYPLPHDPGEVRQILGRPGEVWGAESAADQLIVIRTR
jgi:virginiamycin B lyase